MKAYAIHPSIDVFDGTGTLSAESVKALSVIANLVADCLQQGGDNSHYGAFSVGPTEVGTLPELVRLCDRQVLVAVILRLLDPNDLLGGDVRSVVNCRAATFGADGHAMLCLRHEDAAPLAVDAPLVSVTECSERLAETDLFDGGWPSP